MPCYLASSSHTAWLQAAAHTTSHRHRSSNTHSAHAGQVIRKDNPASRMFVMGWCWLEHAQGACLQETHLSYVATGACEDGQSNKVRQNESMSAPGKGKRQCPARICIFALVGHMPAVSPLHPAVPRMPTACCQHLRPPRHNPLASRP